MNWLAAGWTITFVVVTVGATLLAAWLWDRLSEVVEAGDDLYFALEDLDYTDDLATARNRWVEARGDMRA